LGLYPGADEAHFTAALTRQLKLLTPEMALVQVGGMADLMGLVDRDEEVTWIYKALAATVSTTHRSPDLIPHLNRFLASASPNTAAMFLFRFTGALGPGATRLSLLEQHLD